MPLLTAELVRFIRSAAALKLPISATHTNTSMLSFVRKNTYRPLINEHFLMQSTKFSANALPDQKHAQSALQITIMAVAAFVIVTTEYVILGLLPALARDLGISISNAGLLVTLFAFSVMLFGPMLTPKLSHIERKQLFTFILLIFSDPMYWRP
jgi:cyanate permease